MVSAEMDLKPFMNLMVVLIPMLLLSAEFAKVAVIDIKLPEDTGSTPNLRVDTPPLKVDNTIKLTAILTDSVVTLGAKGGFLPSIQYREFHRYVARDDHAEFTVEYVPGKKVYHPVTGREMTPQERSEIELRVCDENRNLVSALYSRYGELVTGPAGMPLASVTVGDTVFLGAAPRRMTVVHDLAEFTPKPLSVYDELQNRLAKIRERYGDADDRNSIIIAAENGVIYDKIVQVMDKARAVNFSDINIAKLRG